MEGAVGVFFALAGYTPKAFEFAGRAGVALFVFDLMGDAEPANVLAKRLVEEVEKRDAGKCVALGFTLAQGWVPLPSILEDLGAWSTGESVLGLVPEDQDAWPWALTIFQYYFSQHIREAEQVIRVEMTEGRRLRTLYDLWGVLGRLDERAVLVIARADLVPDDVWKIFVDAVHTRRINVTVRQGLATKVIPLELPRFGLICTALDESDFETRFPGRVLSTRLPSIQTALSVMAQAMNERLQLDF